LARQPKNAIALMIEEVAMSDGQVIMSAVGVVMREQLALRDARIRELEAKSIEQGAELRLLKELILREKGMPDLAFGENNARRHSYS
jgi:hypothetical protein